MGLGGGRRVSAVMLVSQDAQGSMMRRVGRGRGSGDAANEMGGGATGA